jgi:catechol 2,3-dioxygenase-like lactoylglutathione lyase family enzyme
MSSVLRFVALRRCVTSLQRSIAFYCDALGFEVIDEQCSPAIEAVLALGSERIVLTERTVSGSGTDWPEPASGPSLRFQHIAIVTNDMDAAFERLQRQAPVAISRGGPQRLPAASGGVCAFKFRDPDAHPLELIEFPPGQGAARWHATAHAKGPTLGIDHAAISVGDVDSSISFYQRLGFRLGTRQLNRGEEQARLDGLELAKVDVATLLPADVGSPHLELLGYLVPKPFLDGIGNRDMADLMLWQARASDSAIEEVLGDDCTVRTDPDGHLTGFMD